MSTEIESAYIASNYEDTIYERWLSGKCFESGLNEGKEPYLICMPPPNATGVLHLGHATMLALEDIMIRFERMRGKEALWLPGTDHAAIATQSVVERSLVEKGFFNPRKELGREKLLTEIRSFVEESKSCIRGQVKKMGASCDWSKEKYTLDEDMNEAVNTVFERMYADGLIYRGGRIVNWDPKMQTTVADDELEYVEETAKFYYFQYGPVVIGTARPETKLGDKVVVVHPEDDRYKDLIGKEFEVEWIEGKIRAKVIADECIDMAMGTGAMTITPAHSFVDFELSEKYGLEATQVIDFEGKIRSDVSEDFGGLSIEEAREKIVERLNEKGLLVKVDEGYVHNVAVNYRGKGVVEPQVMRQWFVDVNKKVIDWKGGLLSIKEVLQDVVRSRMVEIVPDRFEKTYFSWIDNLRDWCISRQIWWGHQIPVWYKVNEEQFKTFNECKDVSSLTLELLGVDGEIKVGQERPLGDFWIRDPDTLDTWFSSSFWTFATLGWPKKTEMLEYFTPSAVLETGYDILFFWVARMILASTYALRGSGFSEERSIPFKTVYLHGLVRDKDGKKMSKSRPETCIDPLDMIAKYGADALRLSLVIGSTPGNDMRLYEEKIAGYRNFINKIWNGARFALMKVDKEDLGDDFKEADVSSLPDKWILHKLNELVRTVTLDLEAYRFSDAGMNIYDFFWRDYCDWYLEMSKVSINKAVLLHVLKIVLKLLHPFVPFVSEKLWEFVNADGRLLIVEPWPAYNESFNFEEEAEAVELVNEIVAEIRKARAEAKVDPARRIKAVLHAGKWFSVVLEMKNFIGSLARISDLEVLEGGEKLENCKVVLVGDVEIYLPIAGMVDEEIEKKRLMGEIVSLNAVIVGLEKKLDNEGFVSKAPQEVVEKEKGRLAQFSEKRRAIEERLKFLG